MHLLTDDHEWFLHDGDCIEHAMEAMPPASVDFSVFSPPFPAVYAYTDSVADLGNSEELDNEVRLHFGFFFAAMRRVMKPGRVMVVHCQQIVRMKRAGGVGTFDFRGLLIRMARRKGFIYEYDWLVPKNPQGQAIRTKSRELQFAGLESDRANSRGAMPDYLIKFRCPGENKVPIKGAEVSRDEWIQWAESAWYGIRETDTLNVSEGRGEDDTKHICPLQLGVIERLVRLYSNPGETVFTPFAGIGSEMYVALERGRRAYGCELKPEYQQAARRNCERGLESRRSEQMAMFSASPEGAAA